jgi:uncharacterized membrane protein
LKYRNIIFQFYKSVPAIVFWQFVNQSFNSIVNYTNRSGDKPITNTDLMKSYAVATSVRFFRIKKIYLGFKLI